MLSVLLFLGLKDQAGAWGHHDHDEHHLTVDNGTGDGDYEEDDWVNIVADAPPSGKVFDRWRGENGPCADRFNPTTSYRMPDDDATVRASYMNPPTYELDVDYGSGDGDYAAGTVVTIVANAPPSGKVFNRWRDDDEYCANRYDSTTTYTMPDRDCRVYAYYEDEAPGGPGTTTTTTTTTSSTTTTTASGGGTTTTTIPVAEEEYEEGQEDQYSIIAVGTVRGRTRVITLEGIAQKTWAQFALWMSDNQNIYFKSGETFNGHVHSNNKMWFSGDPEFFSDCTSSASDYGGNTNDCIFHKGFRRNEPSDSMADIKFDKLLDKAALIVTGLTQVALSGTNIVISNSRMSWVNQIVPVTNDMVVYVVSTTGGSNPDGDLSIAGTMDGRVTFVTDRDINITNHVKYVDDPKTNVAPHASDDAVGLIAKGDVVVKQSCPDDLNLYAHIIAAGTAASRDGSFGVENYSSGSPRGDLIMHGGIVQDVRGAVGTFNGGTGAPVSGYQKMYTYDTRFASNPPPEYPTLSDSLIFLNWKDK